MMSYDPSDGAIAEEHAGSVGISYFKGEKNGNETFPPLVSTFLKQYGCSNSGGKFSQPYLGRA